MKTAKKILSLVCLLSLPLVTAMYCVDSSGAMDELDTKGTVQSAIYSEGTETALSQEEIDALLPWAHDSKLTIERQLQRANGLSVERKFTQLHQSILRIVGDVQNKKGNLLVRFILNRSLKLIEILDHETSSTAVGIIDTKVRILVESMKLALEYHGADIKFLQKNAHLPFSQFGKSYFRFLNQLNYSIFDISAQFRIQFFALELLHVDLNRGLDSSEHAQVILEIRNTLAEIPKDINDDMDMRFQLAELRKLIEILKLSGKEIVSSKSYWNFQTPQFLSGGKYVYRITAGNNLNICEFVAENEGIRFEVPLDLCVSFKRFYQYWRSEYGSCEIYSSDEKYITAKCS